MEDAKRKIKVNPTQSSSKKHHLWGCLMVPLVLLGMFILWIAIQLFAVNIVHPTLTVDGINYVIINPFKNTVRITYADSFYRTGDNYQNLTELTVPSTIDFKGDTYTITRVGDCAFAYCVSLDTIIYTGTMEMWNNIVKGEDWNQNVPATIVHCSDGDMPISINH